MENNYIEATQKRYESNITSEYTSLSVIKKLVGYSNTVLDVGCSSGYLGDMLMGNGNIMYGVDGNQEAIAEARKKYKETLCLNFNTDPIPFSKEMFDVIVFADVLEHLLYPEEVLKQCVDMLKPGGRIIVSLPNVALWRVRLNLLFGCFDYADYGVLDRTHLHLYTFKTAKELVEKCGLKVISNHGAMNLRAFGILTKLFPLLRTLLGIHIIIEAKK
jgi:methionine biosynthesis protein MetW